MATETTAEGMPPSPFNVLRGGKIDEGLTGLTHLIRGPDIHRSVLDLYYFEQEHDIVSKFSSAQMAKLRLIKMKAYERVEDDLKQRRVVLDYPPRPEDVEEPAHQDHLESLWKVLDIIPRAVFAAGLKEAVVVLPAGTRRQPHTREGYFQTFSNAGLQVNGEGVTSKTLTQDGNFAINMLRIDLTQSAEVMLQRGTEQQRYDGSATQPNPTQYEPIPLVTRDDLFHVNVARIISAASFDNNLHTPIPFIIDPLRVMPSPVGAGPGVSFNEMVGKIRQ